MKKLFQSLWPILIILTVVAIFFYPVWLQNKVPAPFDMIVGVYYPWLDYKWGYPTGVPVKNPITSDVVSFTYPMQMLAVDLIKQGHWPLWNPFILTGAPLLANFQSAPFSPTNVFYFLLPKLDAWSLQIMAQLFLAAVFLYLLLREFQRSKIASLLGGLFFAFAGFLMIWLEWNGHSLTAAFFPLIFYLSLKWLKSGRVIFGLLLSLALALQIFSGYPQIILYEILSLAILLLWWDKKIFFNFKKILAFSFFIILGLGLSAIQILPGAELLSLSQRKVEDVINVSAFLPWRMFITFLAPDYFGNHVTKNYWGPGDYTYVTGYSGVVVVILAILGSLTFFKDKMVRFALSLIGLSLLIALPNPISITLKESGLVGLQAASAHRSLVLSNLGIAILAAFGLDAILEKKLNFKNITRAFYLPSIFLLGFLFGSILSFWWVRGLGGDLENLKVGLRNLILPLVFLFLSLAVFLSGILITLKKQILVVILGMLALTELFRFGWKFTPFSPKNLNFPQTPITEFLTKQPTPFRVMAEDVIPINLLMPYGLSRVEGYDAVYPIRFAKYLSTLNSNTIDFGPMGRYGSVKNIDSNLLNLVNAKYILVLKRDQAGAPKKDGKIPQKFDKDFLKPVFEDGTVVVLENLKALPRVEIFYEWEIITDEKQILSNLIDRQFPINEKIILEKEPLIYKNKGFGEVDFEESPNIKNIRVNTNASGVIFIGDSWFPGWVALVDGKQTKILRADYNFMATPVEKGNHEVVIKYQPSSFQAGKVVTLIAGGILIILLLYDRFAQKFSGNS